MKKIIAVYVVLSIVLSVCFTAFPVSAADDWHRGMSTTGNVSVDGEEVTIIGDTKGSNANITLNSPANVGNSFDVEITMAIKKSAGTRGIQIRGSKHRVFLVFGSSTITNNNSAAISEFTFEPGTDFHTYRIVGSGAKAELMIDGYYMGEMELQQISMGTGIVISSGTDTAGQQTEVVVSNVTCRPFTGLFTSVNEPQKQPSQDVEEENTSAVKSPEERNFREEYTDSIGGWKGNLELKDGTYYAWNQLVGQYISATHPLEVFPGEDFRVEFDLKVISLADSQGFTIRWPNYQFKFFPRERHFEYEAASSSSTAEVGELLDDKFHNIVVETYNQGTMVRFYVDGKMLLDIAPAPAAKPDTILYIYTNSYGGVTPSSMAVDWLDFKVIPQKELAMNFPYQGATYLEGSEIKLSAQNKGLSEEPLFIEYRIGKETIAKGMAPDYQATVTNLRAGNYTVTANFEDATSEPISFTVIPEIAGKLHASLDEDGNMTAFLERLDQGAEDAFYVEYLLDGQLIGKAESKPYEIKASGLSAERHNLVALCKDQAGVVLKTFSAKLEPKLGSDANVSMNYANDITYSVSGNQGSATVDFQNGVHRLHLKHTKDGVTYLTDTGEETYQKGIGNFEIITDGAVADVYRNGQLVFSYYLPLTEKIERTITQDGLTVANYQEIAPKEKNNYFIKRRVTDVNTTYELGEIPFYQNLDFVAEKDDEVHFLLNDGFNSVDLTLKGGKFYIWNRDEDKSTPYEAVLAQALNGRTHYRVEVALGMCRLYANGRWLTSFRGVDGGGAAFLFVDVSKGELDYVSVNDNKDLRIYSDVFEGTGDVAANQFWKTRNTELFVDSELGRAILLAEGKKDAIVEWNAYAGEYDFSANVNIEKCDGGFWVIFNHSLTNCYTKIGYNFKKKQFEVVDIVDGMVGGVATLQETVKATAPGDLPIEQDIKVSLRVERNEIGKTATLFVNDNPVISTDQASHRNGMFGFIADDALVYLRDVNYRGDAKIMHGVSNLFFTEGVASSDIVPVKENEAYAAHWNSATREYSSDGGKTWEILPAKDGDSDNTVRLANGELLSIKRTSAIFGKDANGTTIRAYVAWVSSDEGETWENLGPIHDPYEEGRAGRNAMQNRVTQGPSGRIYFSCSEIPNENAGYYSVYYSDDNGRSWTKSKNDLDSVEVGMNIAEVVPLEMQDGTVRAYCRTDRGFIHYFESKDHGETWNLTPIRTPFYSSLNCFNIERDPETGYLYLAWGYDNANLHGVEQSPRSRWSIAMSTDDGVTWSYLGTCHENNEEVHSQGMKNLNINVVYDNLILGAMSVDHFAVGNSDGGRRILLPKDQVVSKRFDQVHFFAGNSVDSLYTLTGDLACQALVINPKTGEVIVNNYLISDAIDGELASVGVLATFLGASVEQGENGGIILRRGDSAQEFTKEQITEKSGKAMISFKEIAERYGLNLIEKDGLYILSQVDSWTPSQLDVFLRRMNSAQ